MKTPLCPLSVWKNLFAAANALREIEPWHWMSDSHVFGVQNPADQQIGYCCVLGELGEVFGLVVYLGSEGLEQHRRIQSGKLRAGSPEMIYSQTCLTAWFSKRGDLDKTDIKIATEVGLKPRGRAVWPQFRSFRPGYHPWFLTEDEANYLTLCLGQTREVALCIRTNPEWLSAPSKGQYRVRVPVKNSDSPREAPADRPGTARDETGQQSLFTDLAQERTGQWRDRWLTPAPLAKPVPLPVPLDEVRLQRIKNAIQAYPGTWEVDGFYMTDAVDGDDRPYYPHMLLCVDHDSGFILGTTLANPATWPSEFVEAVLNGIEQSKFIPAKLLLRKEDLRVLFEPLAARLGIQLEITKKLPAVDRVKREFEKFTQRQR